MNSLAIQMKFKHSESTDNLHKSAKFQRIWKLYLEFTERSCKAHSYNFAII